MSASAPAKPSKNAAKFREVIREEQAHDDIYTLNLFSGRGRVSYTLSAAADIVS
jgi:hypothetical protein